MIRRTLAMVALALCAGLAAAQQETADDLAFLDELERQIERGGTYATQQDLEEYLLDYPRSVRARSLAAEAALERGRLAEVAEHIEVLGDAAPVSLQARVYLRAGNHERLLDLADSARAVSTLRRESWRVAALDGLGQREVAKRVATDAVRAVKDDRSLSGAELKEFGRLLLFLRRIELANQALVFADEALNGRRGPNYEVRDTEVLVLLARVFHEARQTGTSGDQVLTILDDVLDVVPHDKEALVVRARELIYGFNSTLAARALSKALTRDPTLPEALTVRGKMHLLARRADAALDDADTVLVERPRHRDALALRAAALTIGARPGAAEARAAFTAAHPQSAAYLALIGEVLQSHYRFADSIEPLKEALELEPDDERPLPVLAQSLAHVGREEEARAALEEHARRSPYTYPWRTNMVKVLKRITDTLEVRTDEGFVLRLPVGEQDVTGVLMAEALAEARVLMEERWGVVPTDDVLVEVFDKHADFSVRTVGFSGFGALGACFGNVFTTLSPLCELRGQFHWRQTLVHEYAHVITLTLSDARVPRWLTEGISVVEERNFHPSWGREYAREVLEARANDLIVPITRMDELFRDGSTIGLGYYLGSIVADVVEAEYGFDTLRDLVAAFAEDRSTGEAIRHALGVDPTVLDAQVATYIDDVIGGRAKLRPRYRTAGKDALRERVSAGDDDALLPLAMAYVDLGRFADAEATLARFIRARGDGPGVARVRAEHALANGKRREARSHLRSWKDAGVDIEADGLTLLAMLELELDDVDDSEAVARELLLAARDLFPSDTSQTSAVRQLLRMVDAEDERELFIDLLTQVVTHDENALGERITLVRYAIEDGRTDVAIELLREAVDFDPYRPQLRMQLADLLADAGQLEEAAAQWRLVLGMRSPQIVLEDRPVASSPSDAGGLLGHLQGLMGGAGSPLEGIQAEARTRLAEVEG